jgi:hypothetical protein
MEENNRIASKYTTTMEQIAEQIGEDLSEALATNDYQLLYERMLANLEDLDFTLDKMAGKLELKRGEL